jgi:radical SAM protein (TIGR01212 family)
LQQQRKKKIYNKGKWSGKPYNFFGDYLSGKYNCRVLKLPIDAGLSCPNRDGTIGTGGCIFCGEDGSASPTARLSYTITDQMTDARNTFKRGNIPTKYIAYFQAWTNTYGDIQRLKKLYDEAVSFPDVIGLMIGTRPDCINKDVVELISSYKKENFELWIELGMQSIHDKSLRFLRRGHSHAQTLEAINIINQYSIPQCLHLIIGIPGETWEDMMETALSISRLPVQGVKIHHLHIIKNTALEVIDKKEPLQLMTLKEYVSVVCDFIERLRPDILIHRLMGDRPADSLIKPKWGLHKGTVIKAIEDEFEKRVTYQGFFYNSEEF